MKSVQYFTYQQSVWYNVTDYTRLLLDTNVIWRVMPSSPRKRHRQPKTPDQVILAKLSRLNPVYQLRVNQAIYVDWVIFEHLYRLLKPFLVQPADWTNPDSLFRRLREFIDHPSQLAEPREKDGINTHFTEIFPDIPF